jgi:hypothetical protein
MKHSFLLLCPFFLSSDIVSADTRDDFKPDVPVLEVTKDTTLDAKKTYGRLIVKGSNLAIDGKGAWVIGTNGGNPKAYKGVGIEGKGVSTVTLKNVNVRGNAAWSAEGELPQSIERFSLGFDSWGNDPFVVWLDGIQFE